MEWEWSDILVKIGVGACLGFGIIVLAKLGKKKNEQQNKSGNSDGTGKQDSADKQ